MTNRSKAMIVAAVLIVITFLVWQLMTGFSAALNTLEGLSISAPTATLGVGESTQLTVQKKVTFFFRRNPQHPDTTTYSTVSESELVVEPDGQVTCVGTRGLAKDEIWVSAYSGRDRGHMSFDLSSTGPGATLDFVVDEVPKPGALKDYSLRDAPCCGDSIVMTEGQTIHYKLVRRGAPADDFTTKAIYTSFFGSGVPNDARPSVITGGHDYVTFRNFHVDSQQGAINAPPSIGRDNRDDVMLFARYGNLVGWKDIVITHVEGDGREGHLRLHPEDR
jgi:hypothetical protein